MLKVEDVHVILSPGDLETVAVAVECVAACQPVGEDQPVFPDAVLPGQAVLLSVYLTFLGTGRSPRYASLGQSVNDAL